MAGLSVPGNSCCGSITRLPQTGCSTRLSGQCVYYSGPSIPSIGVNTGDLLDTVISKLSAGGSGFITAVNNGLSLSTSTVQLGGSLIKHTTIDGSIRSFDFILNDIRNLSFASTDSTRGQLNISSNSFGELTISNTSTYGGGKFITFNGDIQSSSSTGSGFTMNLPNVPNTAGPQIVGNTSGVAFAFLAQVSAAQGLVTRIENQSIASTSNTVLILQGTGGAGNSSFITLRNNSALNTDYTLGFDDSDKNFKLNSNSSGIFSSGNILTATPTGKVGIGTQIPSATLHIKAGTSAAGTAPVKLTPGVLLTVLELGTLEYTDDGTTGHLYFTLNQAATPTRVQII